jgi:hypothetical protein
MVGDRNLVVCVLELEAIKEKKTHHV